MNEKKIQIAIAENVEEQRKKIITAISETKKYELTIKAENGRDLILKLNRAKKLPAIILTEMPMPSCDGLLTTIICKRLFPQIKIVGLSNYTDGSVINAFYAEGGNSFLSKFILTKTALTKRVYKEDDIFEKALDHILSTNEKFIDAMLGEETTLQNNHISTQQIITNNHPYLRKNEITYLLLTAAGFSREEKAQLMYLSESAIQKYFNKMCKLFSVNNRADLVQITLNFGIAKLVQISSPPQLLNI